MEIAYRQEDKQNRPSESLLSPNTMTKLTRDEPVMLNVLDKICDTLDCNYGDFMDYVPDKERGNDIGQ